MTCSGRLTTKLSGENKQKKYFGKAYFEVCDTQRGEFKQTEWSIRKANYSKSLKQNDESLNPD